MLSSIPHTNFFLKPPPLLRFRPPPSATAYDGASYRINQSSYKMGSGACMYEILRIPVGASGQEIKSAYRRLARICHPDVAAGESSADEFMKIHAAYSTLSDPEKRAVYDRNVSRRTRPLTSSTGRNWETDQCW